MKKRPNSLTIVVLIALLTLMTVGIGTAQEEAATDKTTDATDDTAEKTETTVEDSTAVTTEVENPCIPVEEHDSFLKEELERIEREKRALAAMRAEIKTEIEKMESSRRQLEILFAKMDERKEKRIGKLVKVYQGMEPTEVVPLFANLDEKIMLAVLFRMKEKKQAAILALMNPEKAADISQKLLTAKVD